MNIIAESRIYVVVAKSVQHPLATRQMPSKSREYSTRYDDTVDIIQPAGRIAAQVAHVVSRMRLDKRLNKFYGDTVITTIILSVPDSFQLEFIQELLAEKKIPVYSFCDTNFEAYGSGMVKTAICTEPVFPHEVESVLSWLPLWDGK